MCKLASLEIKLFQLPHIENYGTGINRNKRSASLNVRVSDELWNHFDALFDDNYAARIVNLTRTG